MITIFRKVVWFGAMFEANLDQQLNWYTQNDTGTDLKHDESLNIESQGINWIHQMKGGLGSSLPGMNEVKMSEVIVLTFSQIQICDVI